MRVLSCDITIGSFRFKTVHEVSVKKSMHSYVDTAVIKLPSSSRLRKAGSQETESVDTAKQFQQGDAVRISLGYDGKLQEEFTGFISRVNFTTPCEVECEGYSWQLRRKIIEQGKAWKDPTVTEVLQYAIEGTDIKLSPDIADAKATGKIIIYPGQTALDIIEALKKDALQTIYFIGSTIYSGLTYTAQLNQQVKYKLGWNTIKDGGLKYRRPEDAKVQVSVTYKDKKGKEHHKITGKAGGIVVHKRMGLETDVSAVTAKAKAEAERHQVAGYEGKIVAFLVPLARHGWKATIEDEKYPERAGDYILASTEVQFGMGGGRRVCEITKNLNAPQ